MKRQLLRTLGAAIGLLAGAHMASGQTAVPAALAVPASAVNTNSSGFRARIIKGNTRLQMTAALPAERLMSGKAIDPATLLPFENTAFPNDDGTFWYNIPDYINMHEQIPNDPTVTGGNFSTAAAAPQNVPDQAEPGIPGVDGGSDDFAIEFVGYLQIPQGNVQFGVNSDDGFRLTIGDQTQARVGRQQLLILDGTRGFGNTEGNFSFTAGIYPFRLLFWERGGANSGVEFYAFAPGTTSGSRYLVNDRSQANAIRSYSELTGNPPTILNAWPDLAYYVDLGGSGGGVPPAPYMWVEIQDGGSPVTANSISWKLDGNTLTATGTKTGDTTIWTAQSPTLLPNSVHTNTIVYATADGKMFTNNIPFTVANYPIVAEDYILPSVNTAKPGFRMKIHQMDRNRNPATGLVPNAERQIANGYIDPLTGQPYENTADLSLAGPDGYFSIPTVVNWNQDQTDIGSFVGDTEVPGIGFGTALNGTDRYVTSIETILELKAGPYRFGVNSDDGFRLSFGRGPGDVVGVQLGTAGDRGVADTYMDVLIPKDGFYPVRLMWWETGGGSACEFFVVDLVTGNKSLINDPSGFTYIKAYQESPTSRPYISRVLPTVNNTYVIADEDIIIDVMDGAIPLDAGSAVLTLNGASQTLTSAKSGKVTTLTRKSSVSNLLPSGVVNARLVYSYTTGGTTTSATNNWSFTVPRYLATIPAGNKVQASQVSGAGFKVRGYQIDISLNNNQGNGGRDTGNNMPGAEIELAAGYLDPLTGQPYPNLLDLSLADANGYFDLPEVINANHNTGAGLAATPANSGIFNSDGLIPGMPGGGTSNQGLDNTVHEFQTFLDLKAGAHLFILNVDDGWTAISAPNVKDTLGTLLGFRNAPGGNAGSPANNPNAAFNVVVPEDGIYPFRILFWEGGGGVNAEFGEIDRGTGTQVLVNDTAALYPSTVAIGGNVDLIPSQTVAYSTYTGPVKPWTKFSVYPMPYIGTTDPRDTSGGAVTLWQNRRQQGGPGPLQYKVGLWNGSWNSGEIQNSSTAQRPFGDAVGAVVADLGSGTVGMVLDGQSVTPTVTAIPGSTDKLVLYTPSTVLSSSSNHVAGLIYAGTTNYWTFSVITNVIVPAGAKVSAAPDTSAKGFRVKVAQSSASRANTAAAAEGQLAGTPASVTPPGPGPDGSYIIPGYINLNVQKNTGGNNSENGAFNTTWENTPDEAVPGLPGTGLTGAAGLNYFTAEIFAYLDLPAGYQKFGLNGDDGWKVQIGTPGQTNGPVLFTIDRGAGAQDLPFAFVVPEAGLYPVRVVWYQGTGGGNLEFFTYGSDNRKILVNSNDPNAVKAYYAVVGGGEDPKITKASITGGNITIEWTGGGTLESTTAIGGTWNSTGDSDGSFTEAAGGKAKFYRVKR